MSSVPAAHSQGIAREITKYILGEGYTEAQLKKWGLTQTPWKGSELRPLLQFRVAEDSPINLLVQLFFFGEQVSFELASRTFPPTILDGMLCSEMLCRQADDVVPSCMLVQFGELLIACDSVRRIRSGLLGDLVLGVNRPTQILSNCMLTARTGSAVLDLGTGCGTLAIHCAPFAGRVLGTDINERALEFARFNADLNSITNLEVRAGDRFDPVASDRFDLIFSNPPFFLNPQSKLLFTDNPFTLDSFVESLARHAPAMLKDGGYFQMLCEWVELEEHPWPERLRSWFQDSGCDVLILRAYEIHPVDYAAKRAAESASLLGKTTSEALIEHVHYFKQQKVEKVVGGLITIRRCSRWPDGNPRTANWFVVDEMEEAPSSSIGDQLLERFAAQDFLAGSSEARLLRWKPRLSRDVVLVNESVQDGRNWKQKVTYLERRAGLVRRLGFSLEIAGLVAQWDGSQDLDSLAGLFARQKSLPKTQAVHDFLGLCRRLAEMGLITFDS